MDDQPRPDRRDALGAAISGSSDEEPDRHEDRVRISAWGAAADLAGPHLPTVFVTLLCAALLFWVLHLHDARDAERAAADLKLEALVQHNADAIVTVVQTVKEHQILDNARMGTLNSPWWQTLNDAERRFVRPWLPVPAELHDAALALCEKDRACLQRLRAP